MRRLARGREAAAGKVVRREIPQLRGGKETTVGIKRRNWRREDGRFFFLSRLITRYRCFAKVGGKKKYDSGTGAANKLQHKYHDVATAAFDRSRPEVALVSSLGAPEFLCFLLSTILTTKRSARLNSPSRFNAHRCPITKMASGAFMSLLRDEVHDYCMVCLINGMGCGVSWLG